MLIFRNQDRILTEDGKYTRLCQIRYEHLQQIPAEICTAEYNRSIDVRERRRWFCDFVTERTFLFGYTMVKEQFKEESL